MKNLNKRILLILIIGGMLAVLVLLRFLTPEDTWVCDEGQWVKHGNPAASMPDGECK